jgi:hypothetical protein
MSNKDDDWTPMGNKDKTCGAYVTVKISGVRSNLPLIELPIV